MIYKASRLIAEAFDTHDVKYSINELGEASVVEAAFPVEAGPQVVARFISRDDDNDVAIRVFGLICKVPDAKRPAMLEACNTLGRTIRFFKFYLDAENSINVEADLPVRTDDCCVGECCFEMFIRIMKILNDEYHVLAQAMYADPVPNERKSGDLLRLLSELRDKPLISRDEQE